MHACNYGNVDVVFQLIGHGASVHDENEAFDTALTIAARRLHKDVFAALLDNGAIPTRKEAEILLDADRLDILKLFVSD